VIFCTPWFLLFSVAAGAVYLVVRPWAPARLGLMLVASVVFYFQFAGLTAFLVIASLAAFTYFAGLRIHARVSASDRPPAGLLGWCLVPAVLALLYFRYHGFLATTLVDAAAALGLVIAPTAPWLLFAQPVIVPLGISFFAFEFCHYLVDVYHRAKPVRNPLHFALFALFYPRLASGPIVRYQQIVPQFECLPAASLDDVSQGLLRISAGFAKKFLLADPAAQLVATSFQAANISTGADVLWLCLLLYIRIYMDFGGYCDMAIGIARLWGIKLPENFNFPFLAASPSTFWQRWHITLSTWIRDYIYIPLGGGQVPGWRKALNLLFAMALCGLWHGSAWNFVLWGVLHGVALQAGHGLAALGKRAAPAGPNNPRLRRAGAAALTLLGWMCTQIFVSLTWIFFFFPAGDAWRILTHLHQQP
jgi:alginate O-acetyltransferase complex protein AlgI